MSSDLSGEALAESEASAKEDWSFGGLRRTKGATGSCPWGSTLDGFFDRLDPLLIVLHLLEGRLGAGFYMLQDLDVTLSVALSESVSLFNLKKRRVELADAFR